MLTTEAQIRAVMPLAGARLDPHLPYINPALEAAAIDTPRRLAAFLAQLAHESGELRYMEELADGVGYEGRLDLGNTEPGDGPRFKGHGPIQITGRDEHHRCGLALGLDLIAEPRLICRPEHAIASACWFWNDKAGGLSVFADFDWFGTITHLINGGYTHLEERLAYWQRARAVFGLDPIEADPELALERELALVKTFQASHGLVADGAVGPKTLAALRH